MADDPGDDEPLRERRKRRAQAARIRRAAKRAGKEQAWRATQATGADVAVLHAPPPSLLLATHVRRTAAFLERLEADETCSLSERTRIFVAAVPALARACEATEFRERLEDLERLVGGGLHRSRGVA